MSTVAAPSMERATVDTALDPVAIGPALRAALGREAAVPCVVLDAKYEPGSYCTVQYRLGDDLVTTQTTFDGPEPAGGVPVAPRTSAFVFPDDPRMPGLASVMDGRAVASALGAERADIALVRYRSGKRATVRVELATSGGTATLYGKIYADGRKAAAAYAEGGRLTAALATTMDLVVPRVETLLPDVPMVVWHPVVGADLEPSLDTDAALVSRAAVALAALHAVPPLSDRLRAVDAELARVRHRADLAAQVAPEIGRALVALAAAVSDAGTAIDHPTPGLVHGDCKPSQWKVADAGLALLDFDHCGLADPASDVGTFMASLRQRSRAALVPAFLDAYVQASGGGDALRQRAGWYEVVALTRKALRAFARAPGSAMPGILVDAGHGCLERWRS